MDTFGELDNFTGEKYLKNVFSH